MNTLKKFQLFLQESRIELKKVNWPSKQQTTKFTIFVIVLSIGLAAFLGFWDFAFLKILKFVIS